MLADPAARTYEQPVRMDANDLAVALQNFLHAAGVYKSARAQILQWPALDPHTGAPPPDRRCLVHAELE
jgi:hypothetical protein